jgi:hypothetical protein
MSLSPLFNPVIVAWFERSFRAPTASQTQAWLIAAPTGSGKTLAAFMTAIDDLVRRGLEGSRHRLLVQQRAGSPSRSRLPSGSRPLAAAFHSNLPSEAAGRA